MTQDVTVDVDGGILTVTLNRPGKKNALTHAMYSVLADAVERADSEPSIRVMVLRAHGSLFCAGNDIGDFMARSRADVPAAHAPHGATPHPGSPDPDDDVLPVHRFIRALASATVPIVAAVQGKAVGIGTTMLLHCDLVLMSPDAQLITPFADLGLVPEAGSTVLLTQRVGHGRAFAMFTLGLPMSAQDALAAGLAFQVVPADQLHDQAHQLAQTLAAKPAGSLRATKELMRNPKPLDEHIEWELEVFGAKLAGPEAREAFAAFAEKRSPDFTQFD